MTTTPSTNSPSSSSSSSSSSSASDNFTATEWTETNMLTDLMQQKAVLIGLGALVLAFLFFRSRSRPEEKAARRLVRDIRHVDDPEDVRDLLGDNLPVIVRPALLAALAEIERQVHRGFDKIEHDLERL
jgi:hypothetical protein